MRTCTVFAVLVIIVGACNGQGNPFMPPAEPPIVVNPIPKPVDRSVYARRNFGQPERTSDVYEVFVGRSLYDSPKKAVVTLGHESSGVSGLLNFFQQSSSSPVMIQGKISGLTPGKHGFHIHQNGALGNKCKAAGGHFNPYMQTHGSPMDQQRHVGDLGNIIANSDGVAEVNVRDGLISLQGLNSIIGRAVVVHKGEDDLGKTMHPDSLRTGNAGGRVACGVIGKLS